MQTPSDNPAVRRRRATLGVAGAAMALSVAAAMPAIAGPPNSHAQSHGTASQHADGHGASAAGSQGSDTSGHNPAGNNGTVFIHDVAGDHGPHNVPHVSCNFFVDFFGFDNGQSVTVSFAGQAPTGKDTALGGTWTGVVSTDDARGAGNDFDDELAFTADQLGVSTLGAPAKQGYHVKMSVTTNEPGDQKYKVFWVQPCPALTPSTAVLGETSGTTSGTTTSTGTTVSATSATTGSKSPGGARVLGEHFTRPAGSVAATSTGIAGLPFTGADIALRAAAGLAAIGVGAALLVAARRRRRVGVPG